MAAGMNSVILVGRLTRDVEVRKTNSGTSYARFSVAVDRRPTRDTNGQLQQATADFINCVAWRQTADFLGSYGRKGSMVGVEGSIQTGSYVGKDGNKVYTTDVLCNRVQLLESKAATQGRGDSYGSNAYAPTSQSQDSYSAPQSSAPVQETADEFDAGPSFDISSDDLPF